VEALTRLVELASKVFGQDNQPHRHFPLPSPTPRKSNQKSVSFEVDALWTKDGLRPHWGNIAFVIGSETPERSRTWWSSVVKELGIPLAIIVTGAQYLSITSAESQNPRMISDEQLPLTLAEARQRLFSPHVLGRLRSGQLTLGDIETNLVSDSFAAIGRQRAVLDRALITAVDAALKAELEDTPIRGATEEAAVIEDVMTVAIAYLSARILEDKGFFGPDRLPTYDPENLLTAVINHNHTNGFFKKATSLLRQVHLPAQQALAAHLGHMITFSLIDHHDVGRLYERLNVLLSPRVRKLPTPEQRARFNLQQHYTPLAIAQQMLDHLPLERLRPEERVVFDPAAGSGTLLLAATRRLAGMQDCVMVPNIRDYLARSIMGNDLDPWAELMTRLRYRVIAQIVGDVNLFPDPETFKHENYESLTGEAWDLPKRPRVIVANPPYEEHGGIQRVVRFIQVVTQRMREGDYFAFVLPQAFLTATTHGWPGARALLGNHCHIFDTWLLPEGSIGLAARHATSIITGEMGRRSSAYTMARRVITGAKPERVRVDGFLGEAWVAKIPSGTAIWRGALAPQLIRQAPTIPLARLFEVHIGVTPKPGMPVLGEPPTDAPYQRYWLQGWKRDETFWADPRRVPKTKQFIRYTQDNFKHMALRSSSVWGRAKLLVGRSTNWNSREPMPVRLDTTGFCPNNDVYCVIPPRIERSPSNTPNGWNDLDDMSKLYWVIGILRSQIGQDISLEERNARHLSKKGLESFPLPSKIDPRIIDFVRDALAQEQAIDAGAEKQLPLTQAWDTLDKFVAEAYQIEDYQPGVRTGSSPAGDAWERERDETAISITAQVLEVGPSGTSVRLYIDSLTDEVLDGWVPLPPELPGWALDGTVFSADVSSSIKALSDLQERPWSLRNVRHTPAPYLSIREVQASLLAIQEAGRDD
jgi:N-6 DNA Methylase